jgi:4-amino-4-deoxy-L-arabinose transferase-like glycosyltransferase
LAISAPGPLVSTTVISQRWAFARSRDWAWLTALWLIVTGYNLFKAYHIDDVAHLEIAQWIIGHPLHPMSGWLNLSGVEEPIYRTNQPHLYFYLLAIWGRLFGFAEPAMHVLQSIVSLSCIVLMHRLARSLAPSLAVWATALLILSPAFVVEQNLMVDTPLLAAWLAFFVPLICGVDDENQGRRYGLAGAACAAALLIKYSSVVLLPILITSLVLERRPRQAWSLLIPMAALAAWSGFNYLDYGGVHVATRPLPAAHDVWRPAQFLLSWLVTLGAVTPLGIVGALQAYAGRRRARWPYLIVTATFLGLVAGLALGVVTDHLSDRILWVAFAANAVLIAWALAPEMAPTAGLAARAAEIARAAAPKVYLILWIVGTSAFYVLFSPFIATRHVLLIVAPVTLLCAVRWEHSLAEEAKTFALAATAAISIGLGLSDWRFADFYRTEAARLAAIAPTPGRLWVDGHFGLQWYAKRHGLRELEARKFVVAPGDMVAIATEIPHEELASAQGLSHVRSDVQTGSFFNLFCTARPWRFYQSSYRTGPWSLSRSCVGKVEVFRAGAVAPSFKIAD